MRFGTQWVPNSKIKNGTQLVPNLISSAKIKKESRTAGFLEVTTMISYDAKRKSFHLYNENISYIFFINSKDIPALKSVSISSVIPLMWTVEGRTSVKMFIFCPSEE